MARSISDITDQAAVEEAMREYDRLGQDAFLSRYGYRPARKYRLIRDDGRAYDSKAILGVAYGYQYPDQEPLRFNEFSGGARTVQPRLEALGFRVETDPQPLTTPSEVTPNSSARRNPPWQRDELILALDVYVRSQGNPPDHSSAELQELSEVLNRFHALIGTPRADTLRNANGVYMKLMNFRRFDPAFTSQGKAGLSAGGKLEKEIWASFYPDPNHLAQVAQAIRGAINGQSEPLGNTSHAVSERDQLNDGYEATEGRILTRLHRTYERDRKLVERKKRQALKQFGKLACEVCGFDFRERYGERGAGFIECHHIRPISELAEPQKTTLDELALLCANCHRMVHAKRPWCTIDELSFSVAKNGRQN